MHIFHSQLIDLDPLDTLCTISPLGCFLFDLIAAVMKMHTKIKIGTLKIACYNFQSRVNLKMKFWGYNEKNTGFHLTPKKYNFQLSPER